MEDLKDEKNAAEPWLSVPQFGDWDHQKGALPDYSLDFSKIREMRKQNKREPSRASMGNEEEFINPTAPANNKPPPQPTSIINNEDDKKNDHHLEQTHSPMTRRGIFSYFNCCVKV